MSQEPCRDVDADFSTDFMRVYPSSSGLDEDREERYGRSPHSSSEENEEHLKEAAINMGAEDLKHMRRQRDEAFSIHEINITGPNEQREAYDTADVTVGAFFDKNMRSRQEDDYDYHTYADGHGSVSVVADGHKGDAASKHATRFLVPEVRQKVECSVSRSFLETRKYSHAICENIVDAIVEADLILYKRSGVENKKFHNQGATVTVQVITPRFGYVGWLGDSRAVLFHRDGAVQLTVDHRVQNADERARQDRVREMYSDRAMSTISLSQTDSQGVSALGSSEGGSSAVSQSSPQFLDASQGAFSAQNAQLTGSFSMDKSGQKQQYLRTASFSSPLSDIGSPVSPSEQQSGLEVTRALGDFACKEGIEQNNKLVVTNRADVAVFEITPTSQFTVLASDGLWDALSNEEVAKLVRTELGRFTSLADKAPLPSYDCTPHHDRDTTDKAQYLSNICEKLCIMAKGVKDDNITVVITLLQSIYMFRKEECDLDTKMISPPGM